MKKELIVQKDPKSPISEVFRTLRTNIQFMSTTKKLQTILITSTLPGEGKSYVSSNLAVTFAQAGKKVILIDADMRKGRLYSIFEVSPRPGLSNYLSRMDREDGEEPDIAKYIQPTEVNNLLLIPAGNIPPNPSELLISPQMNNLLEELKEVCDIIIIDGTPCELVTDSVILSRIVDSTVVVTAVKQTKKDNLGRVISSIQNVGGKLAGVVVNKVPISAKKYGEKYYYGSTSSRIKNEKNIMSVNNREQIKKRASDTITQNNRKRNSANTRNGMQSTSSVQSKNYMQQKETENFDISKSSRATNKKSTDTINNRELIKRRKNNTETLEKPKALTDKQATISIDKTNDILNQINSYLENEKKNLN